MTGVIGLTHGKATISEPNAVAKSLSWARPVAPTEASHQNSVPRKSRFDLIDKDEPLGVSRPSFKENPILRSQHPRVGEPVPYQSPKALKLVHGLPLVYTGTAADALKWRSQRPKTAPTPKSFDYVKFNKTAADKGIVSVSEQLALREKVVYYRPSTAQPHLRSNKPSISQHVRSMTHGTPTTASDHIKEVITYVYEKEFVRQQRSRDQKDVEHAKERHTFEPGTTRSTILRQKVPEPEPSALFKMQRFQKVSAVLNTFRSDDARKRALEAHESDGVARLGVHKHGIYAVETK